MSDLTTRMSDLAEFVKALAKSYRQDYVAACTKDPSGPGLPRARGMADAYELTAELIREELSR